MSDRNKKNSGFTLIEIIMVLIIIGILAVFAGMGFLSTIEGYFFTEKNAESVIKSDSLKNIKIQIENIYSISNATSASFTYTKLLPDSSESGKMTFNAPSGVSLGYQPASGNIHSIILTQNASVGDNSIKTYRLKISPYHLNYR